MIIKISDPEVGLEKQICGSYENTYSLYVANATIVTLRLNLAMNDPASFYLHYRIVSLEEPVPTNS